MSRRTSTGTSIAKRWREIAFGGARTSELYDRLIESHRREQWQAAFVWFYGIAVLYLDGTAPEAEKYKRLKGEFEALRVQAYRKDWGLDAPSPEEII